MPSKSRMEDLEYSMSRLEEVSAELFGRAMRLPIAVCVMEQEQPFYIKQIADDTGYSSSNVSAELRRMVNLAMLKEHDRPSGENRQFFTRLDSSLWEIIRIASAVIEGSNT